MNNAMWKDGILFMLRKATEAFLSGEKRIGLSLLMASIEASKSLSRD